MSKREGEIIGYEVEGKIYHPADVQIVRAGHAKASQKIEIIPLRPELVLDRLGRRRRRRR